MEKLLIFDNHDFGAIRGLEIGECAWLVGKDVAEQLGYKNTKDALSKYVDQEDKKVILRSQFTTLDIPNRGLTIINESGFYSLVLGSKLPKAKQFKHWVTSDVLPSIRKHGMYATDNTLDNMIKTNPDFAIKLLTELKTERQERLRVQSENIVLIPQAQAYQDLMTAQGYVKFIDVAQSIEIGRTKLLEFLRAKKILTKQSNFNVPYGRFKNMELFKVIYGKDENGHITCVTMVSPKGLNYIYKIIKKNKIEHEFDTSKLFPVSVLEVA